VITTVNNGIVFTTTPLYSTISSVTNKTDGKTIIIGEMQNRTEIGTLANSYSILRFNSDGTPDSSFGNAGELLIETIDSFLFHSGSNYEGANLHYKKIDVTSDGSIVILLSNLHQELNSNNEVIEDRFFTLLKVNPNGVIDTSFGDNGKVIIDNYPNSTDTTFGFDVAKNLVVDSSDRILVSGFSLAYNNQNKHLTNESIGANLTYRFLKDGQPDVTFDHDGKVLDYSDFTSSNLKENAIIQSDNDGNQFILSTSGFQYFLSKQLADGTIDTSFGDNGNINTELFLRRPVPNYLNPDPRFNIVGINTMTVDDNGNIYLVGNRDLTSNNNGGLPYTTNDGANHAMFITKYQSSGILDTNFGANGIVETDFIENGFDDALSIFIQPNGQILVAGYAQDPIDNAKVFNHLAIARYNTDGTLDTTFGLDGKVITDVQPNIDESSVAFSITLKDDKILVVGSNVFSINHSITGLNNSITVLPEIQGGIVFVRYNLDGSIDPTFGVAQPEPAPEPEPLQPNISSIKIGQLGVADDVVFEGSSAIFYVALSKVSDTNISYNFKLTSTSNSNASTNSFHMPEFSDGVTYDSNTEFITVPAGVSDFNVTLPIKLDLLEESDEAIILTIDSFTSSLKVNDTFILEKQRFISVDSDGNQIIVLPVKYTGPVSFLEYEMLGDASGNVIVASIGNDFINLLGGDDAANGGDGDDVLDGGTGSNFLTGGNGGDYFYLDGRGGTITWSTIVDFSNVDQVNIWGWNEGVSKLLLKEDFAGADGYKGITFHYDLNNDNQIDTSITFTGLSLNELPTSEARIVAENGYLFIG
jgi:uncharacterized delta-60 repeat protein